MTKIESIEKLSLHAHETVIWKSKLNYWAAISAVKFEDRIFVMNIFIYI